MPALKHLASVKEIQMSASGCDHKLFLFLDGGQCMTGGWCVYIVVTEVTSCCSEVALLHCVV